MNSAIDREIGKEKLINTEKLPLLKEKRKRNPRPLNHTEVFVFEVLVHVFILLIILSVFFFTIVSDTEKKALNDEVKDVVEFGVDEAMA